MGDALRDVRVAGHRVLDAVYAAVRDPDWGTVPGQLTAHDVRVAGHGFTVRFVSQHGPAFRWAGRIEGRDGAVSFEFDGETLDELAANRIGLCLLHPIELAGRPALARTDRGELGGRFPDRIAPHQPFLDLVGLEYEAAPGAGVTLAFEGDLFEMEDHRNWTDAGFKTYCTPLRRPYPVVHRRGDRIRQTVRITARAAAPAAPPEPAELAVRVGSAVVGRLPELGVGVSGRPPAPRPAHLYAQVRPDTEPGALAEAATQAAAIGSALDLAILAPSDAPAADLAVPLARVADRLGRVGVFDAATMTTTAGTAAALRAAVRGLRVVAPVGGGTLANFAELNRMRLSPGELDFVTYGVNPRVHHDDDELVMDTLLAQPHTLRDARMIGGGRPVVVAPVTPQPPDRSGDGAFLAAWLVGSIAALVGAAAVTYSLPEAPPVRSVLEALAGRAGAPVHTADAPAREVAALAVDDLLLVANLRPTARTVRVEGRPTEFGPYDVRVVHR